MSDAVTSTWLPTTPEGLARLLQLPQEPNSSSADLQQQCCSLARPSNDAPCCLLVHLSALEAADTLHLVVSARTCELSVQRRGDAQAYIRTMRGTPATQGPPGTCKQWLFDIPLTGFPPHSTLQLKLLSHADSTQCHVYTCQLRQASSQPESAGPPQPQQGADPSQHRTQLDAAPHQPAPAQSQMEELRALLAVASGKAPPTTSQQQAADPGAAQQQGGVLLERLLQAPPQQGALMKSMSAAVARSLLAQQEQEQHAALLSATGPTAGSGGWPPVAAPPSLAALPAAGLAPSVVADGNAMLQAQVGSNRGPSAAPPQQQGAAGDTQPARTPSAGGCAVGVADMSAMAQALAALQQQVAQLGALVVTRLEALEQRLGGVEAALQRLAQQQEQAKGGSG